jgi:signal transduction histidine kinase
MTARRTPPALKQNAATESMERILRQRDRLLAISARLIGLAATAVALLLLAVPGVLPLGLLLLTLPFFAALAAVQWRMGSTRTVLWPLVVVGVGIATIVLLRLEAVGLFDGMAGLSAPVGMNRGISDAMRVLASCAAASAGILLTVSLGRMLILVAAFAATMITVAVAFTDSTALAYASLTTIAGWAGMTATGTVLSTGLLRAARRISSIGRAHRSERHASETEAQRRQGARLLHDTVLATLTLLAHSGVGVSRSALRRQAADDARLLRQLRLNASPVGMSGVAAAEQATTTATGTIVLEQPDNLGRVRKRFEKLGLEVDWHGESSVRLGAANLEAFLLALGECLENVRRHSGVQEAHVTITEDEETVRAVVTDNGKGFVPAEVPEARLGFRESVVGRLREVEGSARVFSAPGAGTTVVLEVPR